MSMLGAGPSNGTRPPRPLDGIRVVEVGVWHAGPGASVILADLGAEVIKVESLRGDPERHNGRFGSMNTESLDSGDWTLIFELSNRNKKSLSMDIATEDGQRILKALIEQADVFVTNLLPNTRDKLGLTYEAVAAINDRIVYSCSSGFGPHGDLANSGAFDTLGQGYSGMLFLQGDSEPVPLSVLVLDQMTAIVSSHAIMTGLYIRERTGKGEEVHASLYSSGIWLMYANLVTTSALGREIDTSWDRRRHAVLRSTFKCGDGLWIAGVHHPEDPFWERFCRALERPDLIDDERYRSKAVRAERLHEVYDLLDAELLKRPREEWLKIFADAGLRFTAVRRFQDVLVDPQGRANDYVVEIDHPRLGTLPVPGYPITFRNYEVNRYAEAPGLGEHSDEILAGIGLDETEIDKLRVDGVIG
jgi:crotonobetainyl-CoA:carnitine CoA-transferase CaiB-like acyl-CoA transferase